MPESIEPTITVQINERHEVLAAHTTLFAVRDRIKPDAEVVIRNGVPQRSDGPLADGDRVVLIRYGEQPNAEQMEILMMARHGPGVHQRVKTASVGIAGCGGLGSAVAIALARTGVGRLRLVDFDVVEPSNLNRQQYFVDQIGQVKVEALAANVGRMNPFVTVEPIQRRLSLDNIMETLRGCDVVAECLDEAEMKRRLTEIMRAELPEVPLVTVSGIAGYGSANAIRTRRAFGHVYVIGDGISDSSEGTGLMAPRVAVAAGHQANLVLRLILGEPFEEEMGA